MIWGKRQTMGGSVLSPATASPLVGERQGLGTRPHQGIAYGATQRVTSFIGALALSKPSRW